MEVLSTIKLDLMCRVQIQSSVLRISLCVNVLEKGITPCLPTAVGK